MVYCSPVSWSAAWCIAVQFSGVQRGALQSSLVECSVVHCSPVQWSAAWCIAVQFSGVQRGAV